MQSRLMVKVKGGETTIEWSVTLPNNFAPFPQQTQLYIKDYLLIHFQANHYLRAAQLLHVC